MEGTLEQCLISLDQNDLIPRAPSLERILMSIDNKLMKLIIHAVLFRSYPSVSVFNIMNCYNYICGESIIMLLFEKFTDNY